MDRRIFWFFFGLHVNCMGVFSWPAPPFKAKGEGGRGGGPSHASPGRVLAGAAACARGPIDGEMGQCRKDGWGCFSLCFVFFFFSWCPLLVVRFFFCCCFLLVGIAPFSGACFRVKGNPFGQIHVEFCERCLWVGNFDTFPNGLVSVIPVR